MTRTHRPGDVLRCEEGSAVVVEPGTTTIDGLLTLLEEGYGGERFAPDNEAVLAAVPHVRVEPWFSCSKAFRDEHCDEYTDDWWSSDGDGKRYITVAWYNGDLFTLGEDAEKAELETRVQRVRDEAGQGAE